MDNPKKKNSEKKEISWKNVFAWIIVIISLLISFVGVVVGIVFTALEIRDGAPIGLPTLRLSASLFFATIISLGIILTLSYFLFWKKIKVHLDTRRKNIITNISAASYKNKEAERNHALSQEEIKISKETSKEIIQEGRKEGTKQKNEIENKAKINSNNLLSKAREQIKIEKIAMEEEIRKEILETSILAAEKIIEKEIDESANKKMIDELIDSLK